MNQTVTIAVEKHRDYIGSKIGMWLFLFTEILLFGGMFLIYSVYRSVHPYDFHNAARELSLIIGTINTLVLLTSSLTMALSISAIQKGNKKLSIIFLILTIILGIIFLVNKYFEWDAKFQHGIYPDSPGLLKRKEGEILFYGLYFVMTGLHGLHVFAGVILLSIMLIAVIKKPYTEFSLRSPHLELFRGSRLAAYDKNRREFWKSELIDDYVKEIIITFKYILTKEKVNKADFVQLENSGLYWHLVDIIWIFLFPLFYLIT